MQLRILAAQIAPDLCSKPCPPKQEGAGKTGCALHPRSRVPNAQNKSAHEHTGSAETLRPSLRNGFTAYFELSPVNGFLATVVLAKKNAFRKNLTPAPGCQDHTTSPYAQSHARQSQPKRPPHLTARS